MYEDLSGTALSRLAHGQICTIVLPDGTERDASWSISGKGFHFCDGKGPGFVPHNEVAEWWPAGVKF